MKEGKEENTQKTKKPMDSKKLPTTYKEFLKT
jgi:hypothetical protein